MNPTSNEGMQLPPPMIEQPPAAANSSEQVSAPAEQASAGAEQARSAIQALPAAPATVLPLPPASPAPSDDSATTAITMQSSSVSVTDDKDLIEKEWVNKAKQIVALNRDDPYKQSEELTVFRADYMKKHYDKNIKLSK